MSVEGEGERGMIRGERRGKGGMINGNGQNKEGERRVGRRRG